MSWKAAAWRLPAAFLVFILLVYDHQMINYFGLHEKIRPFYDLVWILAGIAICAIIIRQGMRLITVEQFESGPWKVRADRMALTLKYGISALLVFLLFSAAFGDASWGVIAVGFFALTCIRVHDYHRNHPA